MTFGDAKSFNSPNFSQWDNVLIKIEEIEKRIDKLTFDTDVKLGKQ